MRNLVFKDCFILSSGSGAKSGVLFGECERCLVENVHLRTRNAGGRNNVTSSSGVTGGLAGYLSDSNMRNCSVANTLVSGRRVVGVK